MLAAEWEIKAGERKSTRDKCRKWRERKRDEKERERERAALAAVQSDGEVELQEAQATQASASAAPRRLQAAFSNTSCVNMLNIYFGLGLFIH